MSEIPQAAIDAAAEAFWELRRRPDIEPGWPDLEHAIKQEWRKDARAALEAALPHTQSAATQRLAEALFAVDGKHHFHDLDGTPKCLCGFVGSARARTQTEHITAAVLEEYNRE